MLKLFYGAVRDLDYNTTDACSIMATDELSATKMLRTYYDTVYYYYEFEVEEQSLQEFNDYLGQFPEDNTEGLYHHAPAYHAYYVFC